MAIIFVFLFFILTLGAAVRKFIGFGDAIFITPILLIFLEQITLVTPLIGLTTLLMGVLVFWFDGSTFRFNKEVIRFFILSLLGLILGSFFLNNHFAVGLKLSLALLVLLVCLQNLYFQRHTLAIHPFLKTVLALISGFFSILFNMPGPTTALYFSTFKKREFRATLSVYFLLIEPLSSVGHYSQGLLTQDILVLFVFLGIPACLSGVLISMYFEEKLKIPEEKFKKRINQFLIIVSLLILVQLGLDSFNIRFDPIALAGRLPRIKDLHISIYGSAFLIYSTLIFLILKGKKKRKIRNV